MTNKLPEVGNKYRHWKLGYGIYQCINIDVQNKIHMQHTLVRLPDIGMREEDRNIFCEPVIFWQKFKELPEEKPIINKYEQFYKIL